MKLPDIRKKFHGSQIDLHQLEAGKVKVWNTDLTGGVLSFHFYLDDPRDTYLLEVKMCIDDNGCVQHIHPLHCQRMIADSFSSAEYAESRAFQRHYDMLDLILSGSMAGTKAST